MMHSLTTKMRTQNTSRDTLTTCETQSQLCIFVQVTYRLHHTDVSIKLGLNYAGKNWSFVFTKDLQNTWTCIFHFNTSFSTKISSL